jgi:hypothetical protein
VRESPVRVWKREKEKKKRRLRFLLKKKRKGKRKSRQQEELHSFPLSRFSRFSDDAVDLPGLKVHSRDCRSGRSRVEAALAQRLPVQCFLNDKGLGQPFGPRYFGSEALIPIPHATARDTRCTAIDPRACSPRSALGRCMRCSSKAHRNGLLAITHRLHETQLRDFARVIRRRSIIREYVEAWRTMTSIFAYFRVFSSRVRREGCCSESRRDCRECEIKDRYDCNDNKFISNNGSSLVESS